MYLKRMRAFMFGFGVVTLALIDIGCSTPSKEVTTAGNDVAYWVTTGDRNMLLSRSGLSFSTEADEDAVITLDTAARFQPIDGFGYALTGGSAMLLNTKLDAAGRKELLTELFSPEGIAISYLRISIGASDLDDHVFSYVNYSPSSQEELVKGFSLEEDHKHLIPVLKEILAINPSVKLMASPWSAPAWMKSNNHAKGGHLKPEFYDAYAAYFVKYLQEMQREGITIDAVTLQNEPENPKNTPSMLMTAEEQAAFVKLSLGPAIRKAGFSTKIVVFDHNCDHPEYPITVLNDTTARKYIDGSAFHLYLGEEEAMSKVHAAHPDKNIYFTEQWTSGEGDFAGDLLWHTHHLVIGATRNWSRNVLEWNLAADENFDPHTNDGGCTLCQGALTIDAKVTRNVSYYIIAHASKFVPAGSVRIGSTMRDDIPNVAFLTPSGKKVLIAVNEKDGDKIFTVTDHGKKFKATLPGSAVATFVW